MGDELINSIPNANELINYDPDTGNFTWKIDWFSRKAGERAGSYFGKHQYYRICIHGKPYKAHHLAFFFMIGIMPEKGMVVDHINGNPSDNRFCNLRIGDRSMNQQNQSRAHRRKNRTSSYLGVSWRPEKNKWRAAIGFNGKTKHIGYFNNEQDAYSAYIAEKRKSHKGNML